jgi:hypothetical protein
MDIWNILRPFDIFYGHSVVVWYIYTSLTGCSKINLAILHIYLVGSGFQRKMEATYIQSLFAKMRPGADVMIIIFGIFRPFSVKKLAFFLKSYLMIRFSQKIAVF